MRFFTAVLALTLCVFTTTTGNAEQITFIYTGIGSGAVGDTSFTDASFTLTAIGDTADRESIDDVFSITHLSASIDLDGFGVLEITSGTRTFVAQGSQIVGLSRPPIDGLDLYFAPVDSAFSTWDMLSSIGPIVGDTQLLQWGVEDVETDGGVLWFYDQFTSGSFQAIVVPEPGTWALAAMGLATAGMARLARRRRA